MNTQLTKAAERNSLPANPGLLSLSQMASVTFLGILFWFAGAMIVRIGTPLNFFGQEPGLLSFLAAIPLSWVSVLLIAQLAKLRNPQLVPGVSMGLAAATFFDGIAITWLPWIYGADHSEIGLGAAWILWGAFTFLGAAFVETYRRSVKRK
ncbi:hypothetical protein GKZ89_10000 [Bacillus mangrovi]|uniref:Uncharacterized protein n=1 Tax=Metabacillus mangrovi TaxID=1491830 RepID=A0A7X2S6M4_9BACI|nr:hypothetical protein [Metabacillus mangrovi]MTH53736.1 hypothetical protein [Metabacillus mangrovi]